MKQEENTSNSYVSAIPVVINAIQQQNNNDKENKLTGFQLHPENINRKGAPLKDERWTDILKIVFDEEEPKTKKKFKYLAAKRLAFAAANGNLKAIEISMDRMDGRPSQSTDITTGGEKIEPRVILDTQPKT